MTGALHVLDGGLQTTVQDLGRGGLLSLGIARSGALDPVSLRLGNLLLDNEEACAALEFRSPGAVLRISGEAVRVAVSGTDAGLLVERHGVITHWPSWRGVEAEPDDILHIPPFADVAVGYLHIAGGLSVDPVLGSRSTALRGGFGGIAGRALATGDCVPLAVNIPSPGPLRTLLLPPAAKSQPVLRVMPGPQDDHFPADALRALASEAFRVGRDLDRMGLRLEGPELQHIGEPGIVSDGTAPGALQVPGSGQPILLLADCQTTGGYPKIATVISADLPVAGRLTPGTKVRFRFVDEDGARIARESAAHDVARMRASIVPLREPASQY
jgi:biotin-dependent carboxylase-like uncharacterized protein